MIHIIEIPVEARGRWGDVITKDIALPGKLRKIRAVMAHLILGEHTYFERLAATNYNDNGEWGLWLYNPLSVQIGVFSMSVNNTQIVNANTPICATNELIKSGYKHNIVRIDGGVEVPRGSMARIVIEEKQQTPFIDDTLRNNDRLYEAYGRPEVMRNDYTVKIYIDYEK